MQVLSLANSYTVKAGDVLVGIGVRPDRCIRFRLERYPTCAQCADYRWTDADPVCGYQQQFADGYLFDQYSRRDGRLDIGVLPQRELYGSDGGVHHFQLQADSGAADEWRFGGISGHPGTGCEPCDAGERHSGGRYVTEAVSGSPAYDAGIQPGDIIVKFGTKEIGSSKSPGAD